MHDVTQSLEEMTKDAFTEIATKNYDKGVIDGANYVIKTLRDAMKVSGAKYVYPMWLDTAEKELKKLEEKSRHSPTQEK